MKHFAFAALLAVLLTGCVSPPINWPARVGQYTYDQAIVEYGPPDKSARLQDGSIVAEWMTRSGQVVTTPDPLWGPPGYWYGPFPPAYTQTYFPATFLRLMFGPDGKLKTAKSFAK